MLLDSVQWTVGPIIQRMLDPPLFSPQCDSLACSLQPQPLLVTFTLLLPLDEEPTVKGWDGPGAFSEYLEPLLATLDPYFDVQVDFQVKIF